VRAIRVASVPRGEMYARPGAGATKIGEGRGRSLALTEGFRHGALSSKVETHTRAFRSYLLQRIG
jgi:hypothetical protein